MTSALKARIADIEAATALLGRNLRLTEWRALESNLTYIAAKANAALAALHAMQQAWIDELDADLPQDPARERLLHGLPPLGDNGTE